MHKAGGSFTKLPPAQKPGTNRLYAGRNSTAPPRRVSTRYLRFNGKYPRTGPGDPIAPPQPIRTSVRPDAGRVAPSDKNSVPPRGRGRRKPLGPVQYAANARSRGRGSAADQPTPPTKPKRKTNRQAKTQHTPTKPARD